MKDENIMTEIVHVEIGPDTVCCANCKNLDVRTKFCRVGPPTPTVVNGTLTSKFPKIELPKLDYCSKFERSILID